MDPNSKIPPIPIASPLYLLSLRKKKDRTAKARDRQCDGIIQFLIPQISQRELEISQLLPSFIETKKTLTSSERDRERKWEITGSSFQI